MKKRNPCPVIQSIESIGSKWRLMILNDLQNTEKRFNEIKRSTDASSRTLSRVLQELVEEGFVQKRIEDGSPIASYYSLTDKGESLFPVFEQIEEWADEWL